MHSHVNWISGRFISERFQSENDHNSPLVQLLCARLKTAPMLKNTLRNSLKLNTFTINHIQCDSFYDDVERQNECERTSLH